jgi:hypothetical protein
MKSSRLSCFTGQITNWIGVLSYYFSDISIDISKYDRINNYLDYLKIHYMDDVLYEKFVSFLNESDITELERESYVEALLEYIAEENNKPLSDRIAYRNMYERNLYYKNILNVMQVLSSIDDTSREIYDRNNVSTHILPRLINGAIYKPMTKSYDNVIVIDYKLLYSHHVESEVINTDTHLEYELMPKLPKKTHTFPKHFKGHIYHRTPYYNKKSYNNKKLFSKNYR